MSVAEIEVPVEIDVRTRVLVVNDDAVARQFAADALRAHVVDLAAETGDGLELLRSNRYDAVVFDVRLSTFSGITLFRQLREQHDVAIVILAEPGSPIIALEALVDDCCIRPIGEQELADRVESAIAWRGRRAMAD